MKISVIGTGYVGLSLSVLLARNNDIVAVDIVSEKVDLINSGISPIADKLIEKYLSDGNLSLKATVNLDDIKNSDYVIIATPTNFDLDKNYFDTKSVESSIVSVNKIVPKATIVIKSTVPIGFTKEFCKKTGYKNVLFSPEFLREGKALYDNLYPSRIVVGMPYPELLCSANTFMNLLEAASLKETVPKVCVGSSEAECIKLFANTYLAMRVAFFNELDSFALLNQLNSKQIIEGISLDPRIGNYYNNPSFGYGGYCLPKDSKQLRANFVSTPNALINAIVESNAVRKKTIVNTIESKLSSKIEIIGAYRLIMKSNSDNMRDSSIIDILKLLESDGYKIIFYEPTLQEDLGNWQNIRNQKEFMEKSDLIIANRMSAELECCINKVFCRDVFFRD